MKRLWIRAAALLLALLMMIPCCLGEESGIPEAKARSQAVRVLLTRLAVTDRLDLTLVSPYQAVFASGGRMGLPAGSSVYVRLMEDSLYLYCEGLTVDCGSYITLNRAGEGKKETGFRKTNFPALYMGDLALTITEGKIQPVLNINVEDYLLGVVPYEMSDSFPLEALKAQAVAARTYALRRQSSGAAFDLYDTTADQVFFGYTSGYSNAEKAVRDTAGVCGFYQGKLAMCYYAASNGGQTELVSTAWPTRDELKYYASVKDPYDVENPASSVQAYELAKTQKEEAPYALRKLIAESLSKELTALGFDPAPESVRLDKVCAATVEKPNHKDSLLMTQLKMTVRISGRTKTVAAEDTSPDEVSLFLVEDEAAPSPSSTPAPTAAPEATPAPVYGSYTAIDRDFVLTIDIFPTAEGIFGLNLSGNSQNEIWSVTETDTAFRLEARRYGHGVGMSQRGAQWMALAYGKTYTEILNFYYPGMELKRYPAETVVYAEDLTAADPGPAITPTPRPTLMPLTATPAPGQKTASVTGIAADSSLNLRASPSLNAEVIMRLYKNQKLLILERCEEDGWLKVCTDSVTGYVMEKFLTVD